VFLFTEYPVNSQYPDLKKSGLGKDKLKKNNIINSDQWKNCKQDCNPQQKLERLHSEETCKKKINLSIDTNNKNDAQDDDVLSGMLIW